MDLWFALFVAVVALIAAVGFSLTLVGYINVLPASAAAGRHWLRGVLIVPAAIVALPVAVVFMASPFMDVMEPKILARWLAIPAGIVHAVALVRFLAAHWAGNAKTGKQLGGGLLLMALAAASLYGAGPLFAERIVAAAPKPAAPAE